VVRAIEESCRVGVGLFRNTCGRDAVSTCCDRHGELGDDHSHVCSRKICRRKRRDVLQHLQWKQAVYESNKVSVCGRDGCGERMRHTCSKCRLLFCNEHVTAVRAVRGASSRDGIVPGMVCEHCRDRSKIWD
jgi:hypothetical protein